MRKILLASVIVLLCSLAASAQAAWDGATSERRDWATPKQYANGWQQALNEVVNTALKILDGYEYRKVTQFGAEMLKSPPDAALDRASLRHENAILRKQQAWLKRKKPRNP